MIAEGMASSPRNSGSQAQSDLDKLDALAQLAGLDNHERLLVDQMLARGIGTVGDRLCLQAMCHKHLAHKNQVSSPAAPVRKNTL
jgi:hypothetical protein